LFRHAANTLVLLSPVEDLRERGSRPTFMLRDRLQKRAEHVEKLLIVQLSTRVAYEPKLVEPESGKPSLQCFSCWQPDTTP
ncbi:MAG: hypothetical protein J2P37_26950, partial [Ktedonobacteraceae bacterium]|nr:hypothetical protein [Ktedonobacteraceae bacterium]